MAQTICLRCWQKLRLPSCTFVFRIIKISGNVDACYLLRLEQLGRTVYGLQANAVLVLAFHRTKDVEHESFLINYEQVLPSFSVTEAFLMLK